MQTEGLLYDHDKIMEEIQMAFSAVTGEGCPTTMRLFGEAGKSRINILIDSGSTLSFISEATVAALGCTLELVKPLLVKVRLPMDRS